MPANWWEIDWLMSGTTQEKVLVSIVIIALLLILRSLVLRLVRRRVDEPKQQYRWRRVLTYITAFLILVLLWQTWFTGFKSIATFLGIVGAGIAVAMHDTVANMTGFAFILMRRPFDIGDRIEIAGTVGDVIDLRLFQFTVLEVGNWVDADQSTGRIVHVPNGMVLREKTANFTRGFEYIWHEIPVLVTFESNWKKAKDILEDVLKDDAFQVADDARRQVRQTASRYLIHYGKLTPIVYTTVRDSGVLLTIRYLTPVKRRRGTEQQIWEGILTRFAEHEDIEFAYPTIRYYEESTASR